MPEPISTKDIQLIQTSLECPEQYSAFLGLQVLGMVVREVGYLRLREGTFTVEYPCCGSGTFLLTEMAAGDGSFEDSEREAWLDLAKKKIVAQLNVEARGVVP
jgi:hypothetical protein